MFGKHFASMYSGSLFGKPAIVFAVWGYVLAKMEQSRGESDYGEYFIELSPLLLTEIFASTPDAVLAAIQYLASPDKHSRSQKCDGRRLVPIAGVDEVPESGDYTALTYHVVNAREYNNHNPNPHPLWPGSNHTRRSGRT